MPTTSNGAAVSISNTPQARDDAAGAGEDRILIIDVMANDRGGAAKKLYTVDQTNPLNAATTAQSALGATIKIVDGKITYDPTGALQALGQGETATDTFTYAIRLGNGALSVATVTVTATGANDGPSVAVAASGAVTEDASPLDGETANGAFSFSDPDLTDQHVVSAAFKSTTGDHGQLGALTPVVAADSTGSGAGSIGWSYNVADSELQYLAAGQTVTETYTVTLDDQHGGVTIQDVSVVITGANDAPVLAAQPPAGGLLAEQQGQSGSASLDSASIHLSFTDVDLADTHTSSIGAPQVAYSGGAAPAGLASLLADAVTTSLGEAAGAGTLTVTFAAPDSTFDFLGAGETLTVSYDVTVADGHGGSSTRPVTFTIEGAADRHLAQLLQNPSFEADPAPQTVTAFTQISGWTRPDGTPLLELVSGVAGSDGHVLDTQATPGGVTISQSVDVETGESATLSLRVLAPYAWSWGQLFRPNSTLTISFNGQVVAELDEGDFQAYNQFQTFTFEVIGQAGADTLTIHDNSVNGLAGYSLDWVKLEGWVV